MSTRALLLATCLLGAAGAAAQEAPSLRLTPAPADACDADVFAHVLAAQVEGWGRVGEVQAVMVAEESAPGGRDDLRALYQPLCGASAAYHSIDGVYSAQVLLVAFGSQLDALGFFGALRGPGARHVPLTAIAYRQDGALHANSGRYYLRVEVTGPPTATLQPDQHLAARLEEGLPTVTALPRMMAFFPRGWLRPLAVSYAPATLLGEDAPMAFTVRLDLRHEVEVGVADVGSEARAAALYGDLLERTLAEGRAFEVPALGQEGFAFRRSGCPVMVMRQDEFLSWVCGDPIGNDAEALLRLLGTAIRTSRPLPTDTQAPSG